MDFRFTDEQEMMAQVVRDLLADHCTPQHLRQLMQSGAARDARRWQALCDLGMQGMLVAEDQGGLGLGPVDFVQIAQAAGHAALPEPLVENTGIALPLLAELAPNSAALARALAGEISVALAHPANPFVPDADSAGAVLLVTEDGVELADPAQLTLVRQESIDPFRRLFSVTGRGERIASRTDAEAALAKADDRGALFTAAQLLGLAQRAIELAVAYAQERQQFGKPIGAYQAIKHLLATAQVKVEFARPVLYSAAAGLPVGDLLSRARVSQAKIACAEAADLATRTAVQVHGAMGYSWEVDVHVFLKRSVALTGTWGSNAQHRKRVAARVFAGPLGPASTFAREAQNG